MQKEKLL